MHFIFLFSPTCIFSNNPISFCSTTKILLGPTFSSCEICFIQICFIQIPTFLFCIWYDRPWQLFCVPHFCHILSASCRRSNCFSNWPIFKFHTFPLNFYWKLDSGQSLQCLKKPFLFSLPISWEGKVRREFFKQPFLLCIRPLFFIKAWFG